MPRRYKPRKVSHFDWSPDIAYAIGLLTTDGCLSSDRRHVFFTSQDIDQITNIQLALKIKSGLGISRNKISEAYRLTFSNVQMYDWLIGIGLIPNKSLTLGMLEIPDKYFIDFLRGHLDGDGSITTYTDKYNISKNPKYIYKRIFVRFVSASNKHLEWLHESIKRLLGTKGAFHRTKIISGKNPMYIIKFGKKESLKLLAQIYYRESIPSLARKKLIYTNFLNK